MLDQKILTIDLGTSSIRTALSVISGDEKKTYLATAPSRGIKSGNIVNLQSAADSLQSALNKLKLESSTTVPPEAYVLITGAHTLSYKVETKITFPGWQTISYSDVNEVKNKAKKELLKKLGQSVRQHYSVIHIIPQEFVIENLSGIQNPIGHNGRELGMKAFIILATKSSIKNIESLLRRVNLNLKSVVLQSLASYYGIRDDKTYFNNNLLLYMGAGNTEYIYFREDKPILSQHIPFGSEDILEALVNMLKVSRKEAERLFFQYGSAYAHKVNPEEIVNINYGTTTKKLQRIYISAIIHLQLRKLFRDIKESLAERDPTFVSNLNRIFLTGGLSKLQDIDYLAGKIFKAPAVTVETKDPVHKDPSLSPIIGTANYVLSLRNRKKLSDIKEDLTKEFEERGFFGKIFQFISELI